MSLFDTNEWQGRIFIDGWCNASGGIQPVTEPATGDTIASLGLANQVDVFRAARIAQAQQPSWAATSPEKRAAVFRRAGEIWERNAAELGRWLIREAGSVSAKANFEIHTAAGECFEAAALPSYPHGEVLTSNEDRWSLARRRPVGVVSVIAPFNFPLILSIRSVAPALALGNAVLLKPDPRTGVSGGVALARVFEEAGLPPGLLHVLPGGADVGQALVTAPEVSVISFTGSTAAGRSVAELAGRNLKRAHLELGGNNALIVLPGADLNAAASAGAFGSFFHQGQICMTTGRHLVHESVADEYVRILSEKARTLTVGDPSKADVALGPIIDDRQVARIDSIISASVKAGARIVAGGTHEGRYFQPTVITDLNRDNPAYAEEIFGPVAPVLAFSTADEAVELVNANSYGLSVGILGDVGQAMKIADRIDSGKIHINEQTVSDEANAPFGGVKNSGTGSRLGGPSANFDAFTDTQWVTVRPDIAPYPF